MPNIGFFHPQIVHFVIALLVTGVLFRLVSLTGKLAFTNKAAFTLLLVGTGAAVLAVKSGTDAHGPAERVPGARPAVVEHEEWGERTRNLFLVILAVELAALALPNAKHKKMALIASAVLGVGGIFAIYETGDHGGELVYNYAGGVGVRSGQPEDLKRLLLAGLYHNSMFDRSEGRSADAARLIDEMARQYPTDPTIQFLKVESMLVDRGDAQATLNALGAFPRPENDPGLQVRLGLLTVDALRRAGMTDSARVILNRLDEAFPGNRRIEAKRAETGQ